MARVLYITSSAHSGSTLLDLLVGSMPQVFSTGEVKHLPYLLRHQHDASTDTGNACSCLRSLRGCPAWSAAVDRVSEHVGYDVWAHTRRFNLDLMCSHYNGERRSLRRKLKPHGVYGHVIQHGHWRWLQNLWNRLYRRRVLNNWMLFDTLGEVTGAEVVVDSSKDIRRLNLLCTHRRQDVSVILLMRSLPGCAHSAINRGRRPAKYARSWVRHYNRIHRLLGLLEGVPVLPVQYEWLCAEPAAVRRQVADFLRLPDPGGRVEIDTRRYHVVRGNQLRYSGPLEVRPRQQWRDQADEKMMRQFHRAIARLHPGLLATGLDPFATGPEPAAAAGRPAGQNG